MKVYKVVPYVASISTKQTSQHVAASVENIINDLSHHHWQFETIAKVETIITDHGCFGWNAQKTIDHIQLIVFSKESI